MSAAILETIHDPHEWWGEKLPNKRMHEVEIGIQHFIETMDEDDKLILYEWILDYVNEK